MASIINTRSEWNAIPVTSHVLVQYTGDDGDGPGEVVFVRFAETVRYPYGPYRVSGGANWDALWDNVELATLLSYTEAKDRHKVHMEQSALRALARLREVMRQKDEEPELRDKPFGGFRLALRRFWG